MFKRRRKGPWPPPPPEPGWPAYKYTISSIREIVPGGILRSGKTAYGSGTGWWLGCDPADDESKFDIGTPTDYLRYDETNGLQIAADGSGLTNITGGNITAATLSVISAQTGALTVSDTLTMGESGIITWMSGAAKITDDYMDVALTTSDRYAFRFLDSDVVHAYFAAYKSTNLTQVSIEAIGPAEDKYGKIALAATEFTGVDPETVDMIIRSDTGVTFGVLNYGAARIFKVDSLDAYFTHKVAIGPTAPAAKLHVDQSSTTAAIPALLLDQADVSEEIIHFISRSHDDYANRTFVDAANYPNIGALAGYLKIYVEDTQPTNPITDGAYYIPFYAQPTA